MIAGIIVPEALILIMPLTLKYAVDVVEEAFITPPVADVHQVFCGVASVPEAPVTYDVSNAVEVIVAVPAPINENDTVRDVVVPILRKINASIRYDVAAATVNAPVVGVANNGWFAVVAEVKDLVAVFEAINVDGENPRPCVAFVVKYLVFPSYSNDPAVADVKLVPEVKFNGAEVLVPAEIVTLPVKPIVAFV